MAAWHLHFHKHLFQKQLCFFLQMRGCLFDKIYFLQAMKNLANSSSTTCCHHDVACDAAKVVSGSIYWNILISLL